MKRSWILSLAVAVMVVAGLFIWRTVKFDRLLARDYPELDGGVYDVPITVAGKKYLVPPDEVYDSGNGVDGIPAINAPRYVDIYTADQVLADDVFGIDVEVGGQHYFYPYQIMNWHEVVNDTLNDVPLAITYSTLCGTPIVYERTVDGVELQLAVSGKVYNSASLLTDGTTSTLWNQATGQAIVGQTVGQQLVRYPSLAMSWATWKQEFSNGLVLSTETGFSREYGRHPYGSYETSTAMYFPVNHLNDHLQTKEVLFDVTNGVDHAAYSIKYLGFQKEPNLTVGQDDAALNTVAMLDYDSKVVKVFNREVDGRVLTFVRDGDEFTDNETGSIWNLSGIATGGELKGKQLEQLIAPSAYTFCYSAMYPRAVISGDDIFDWDGDGIVEGADEGAVPQSNEQTTIEATN